MADETAWLIERADPKHPGCVTGHFLGFEGQFDGYKGEGVGFVLSVNVSEI